MDGWTVFRRCCVWSGVGLPSHPTAFSFAKKVHVYRINKAVPHGIRHGFSQRSRTDRHTVLVSAASVAWPWVRALGFAVPVRA